MSGSAPVMGSRQQGQEPGQIVHGDDGHERFRVPGMAGSLPVARSKTLAARPRIWSDSP
jgi:hypothetical protein